MTISDSEMKRLQKLCKGATPGPWAASVGGPWAASAGGPSPAWVVTADTGRGEVTVAETDRRDAEFIAAARTALPVLLDEVRQLRAEMAEGAAESSAGRDGGATC